MKIDKVYLSLAIVLILFALLWGSSCRHDALIPSNIDTICFEKDVRPIFQHFCSTKNCHDGTGESDLILKYYPQIRNAVVPGKPYSSRIYKAIISRWGENKMPPDKPLTPENRILIRLWIEKGADSIPCPKITWNKQVDPFLNNK
jgi:hypothetical protein